MPSHRDGRVALVVEDEPLIQLTIVQEFEARGWTVLDAAAGEHAMALLPGQAIDILFTDIELAGRMSGWDVAEIIRATDVQMPVVYASGNASDRSRQVAGSLFFNKPYEIAEVVEACHRLIDTVSE